MRSFFKLVFVLGLTLLVLSCSSMGNPKTINLTQNDIDALTNGKTDESPDYLKIGVNFLENGDFSDSSKNWGTYFEGGSGNVSYLYKRADLTINSTGNVEHGFQFFYDGFRLINGGHYILTFKASSSKVKDIQVCLQLNGGDYHAYAEQSITLDENEKQYSVDFVMNEETDVAPRLAFNMGKTGNNYETPVTVSIADVKLVLTNEVVEKIMLGPSININQLGFLVNDEKTAYFRNCTDKVFYLIDETGEKVFSGKIKRTIENYEAGEYTSLGDFSSFKKEGIYHIETENPNNKSYSFKISNEVYNDALFASFKMFYLQRCGMELDQESAGVFSHAACHTEKARIHGTYDYIDVTGGWHDAGDYGRYVVPGAKAVIDLFLAYESNQKVFDDNNIDVLDEVKYELDWMLKMQRSDGGVYHKVTCAKFPGFIMPEEETEKLYVSPVSTCATGDFASVMAMASWIYKEKDVSFSVKCLEASKKAWEFLNNSKRLSFTNPTNVETGVYPDGNDKDERYLAACALYKATGKDIYHDYIKNNLSSKFSDGLGWADMGAYGNALYLSLEKDKRDTEVYNQIKEDLLNQADLIIASSLKDGYQISLDKYEWGSNMSICNNAMLLLMANDIKANKKYLKYAQSHLDYLLGANSLGYCFLTGYGSMQVKNPHHRPSIAKNEAMPGMLSGGPDELLEDGYAKIALANTSPAKCFVDNAQSYSTNEITIYWNSPFVYLLSRLMK